MKSKKEVTGKKRAAIVIVILCLLFTVLTACSGSGLNGTYQSTGSIAQTFTFSDNNQITMSAFGINASGTYKIDNDKMTVNYSILGMNSNWTCTFKQDGDSIYINGTKFVKQ